MDKLQEMEQKLDLIQCDDSDDSMLELVNIIKELINEVRKLRSDKVCSICFSGTKKGALIRLHQGWCCSDCFKKCILGISGNTTQCGRKMEKEKIQRLFAEEIEKILLGQTDSSYNFCSRLYKKLFGEHHLDTYIDLKEKRK